MQSDQILVIALETRDVEIHLLPQQEVLLNGEPAIDNCLVVAVSSLRSPHEKQMLVSLNGSDRMLWVTQFGRNSGYPVVDINASRIIESISTPPMSGVQLILATRRHIVAPIGIELISGSRPNLSVDTWSGRTEVSGPYYFVSAR